MRERWDVRPLGSVARIQGGGTPSKRNKAFWNGEIPWVSPKDVKTREINSSMDSITEDALGKSPAKLLPAGSILVVVRSGILARTVPIAVTTAPVTVNQDIKALIPKAEIDTNFLLYFLESAETILLERVTRGATVHRLSTDSLRDMPIPLPPLPEQRRIVAILDEVFEGIDRAIAHTEKNLAAARELFESYLNRVFTEKGEGWEERKLGEVAENLDRLRVPITKSKRVAGNVPYYGASGVVDHVADYLFDEDLLLVSEDGANLLARTYPIAFSIRGKAWVNNHAHVLRFPDVVSQLFAEYYLNSISLEPWVSGMAQPKLNQRALNSIPVPDPSDEVKETVVRRLDSLSESRNRLTSLYTHKLASLSELKQSILRKAFSGELTGAAEDLEEAA